MVVSNWEIIVLLSERKKTKKQVKKDNAMPKLQDKRVRERDKSLKKKER